jgi:hypothetical protein
MGVEFFHVDGQVDMTKLTVLFAILQTHLKAVESVHLQLEGTF